MFDPQRWEENIIIKLFRQRKRSRNERSNNGNSSTSKQQSECTPPEMNTGGENLMYDMSWLQLK